MKKCALLLAVSLSFVFLCSCKTLPDRKVVFDEVLQKISKIDEYKEDNPQYLSDTADFRGVLFGSDMQEVYETETLYLTESYTNALDFENTDIYNYSMQPTYWFNEDGLLYRGTYRIKSKNAHTVYDDISSQLRGDFGVPFDENFYDFNGEILQFDSTKQSEKAIASGEAYFYTGFRKNSFYIELFLQTAVDENYMVLPEFQISLAYTDYYYFDY